MATATLVNLVHALPEHCSARMAQQFASRTASRQRKALLQETALTLSIMTATDSLTQMIQAVRVMQVT
jgi:hypothetical protein